VILCADFPRAADPPGLEALGRLYAAAEPIVLAEGGVIDRFVGDPLMASFGALDTGPADDAAGRALRCAERLLAIGGELPVTAVALHHGPVVSGEVGSARQRAFGVVGDTVNTARRLLDWARERGLPLAVSGATAEALSSPQRATLAPKGEAQLRGLDAPLAAWGRQ
jgi:class 3 adenylate cyclase